MGGDAAEAMRLMCSSGERGEEFVSAIRRGLDNITDEIRLSMSYFENQSNSGIQEMYLTGGCSRLKPLDYLIVEDSNINGHPVYPEFGAGPMEAILAYQKKYPDDYNSDTEKEEKFGFTFAPSGFLIRK